MTRVFLILVLLLSAPAAKADLFYTLVGVKCNLATDRLIVYYVGAYNYAGEQMVAASNQNEFDPWKLRVSPADERDATGKFSWDRVLKTRRTCKLSHGEYEVRLGARGGGGMGACDAEPTTIVEIRRGNTVVLPRRSFEPGECHSANAKFLTRIQIDARSPEPRLKDMPYHEFVR